MASLLVLLGVLYLAVCSTSMDYHLQEQNSHQLLNLDPGLPGTFSTVTMQLLNK